MPLKLTVDDTMDTLTLILVAAGMIITFAAVALVYDVVAVIAATDDAAAVVVVASPVGTVTRQHSVEIPLHPIPTFVRSHLIVPLIVVVSLAPNKADK